jgi:cytidylate kinase
MVERARRRFVRHFFHVDLRDPHGYDMTLNTDRLSIDEAARIVANIVPSPSPLLR